MTMKRSTTPRQMQPGLRRAKSSDPPIEPVELTPPQPEDAEIVTPDPTPPEPEELEPEYRKTVKRKTR